jgi:hypothetical protein
VDGLQSEALNSLDATYVFVRQTKSVDGLLFDNKNATKIFFLCRRYFDNGAGYTNTNAFVSQTLTHLDRKMSVGNSALNTKSPVR